MSYQAVKEYLALLWGKYQVANRKRKGAILDEVVENLGLHRKAAIRLMNSKNKPRSCKGKSAKGKKRYSDECKEHLIKLWRMTGYMCSVRLKAAIPLWIERYPILLPEEIKEELLQVSVSSIERFLKIAKAELRRKHNTGTRRGVRSLVTEIPIRDCSDSIETPGHCEIDCVAHCGGSLSGIFAWTLNFTDIYTGWTECESLWGKTAQEVKRALETLEARLPFPLTHLYFDNGCEFLNDEVINKYARNPNRKRKILVQRGRPYRKNDQCFIEQKNYTHVRLLFGYGRLDWKNAISMMNNVYRGYWRKVQNFYCPQQKLVRKQRQGSKVVRKMSAPETPYQRLRPFLGESRQFELDQQMREIDPIIAMKRLRKAVRNIFGYFKNTMEKAEWGKLVK